LSEPDEQAVPRFAPGVRLKYDEARTCWVVLAPERVLMPDETALEILRRCDGQANLATIIDGLTASYDVDRAVISADVRALIEDLTNKGILRR
jgi:pyrroloquinoline quinone biosynthesis protein D